MKKKHPFLLLELLIALSLFSMCLFPLIKIPFESLSHEVKSCQRMALQRMADLCFAEIEMDLFQQKIPWEDLDCSYKERTELEKKTISLPLKGLGAKKFEKTVSIFSSRRHTEEDGIENRLVCIRLEFRSLNDPHFFFKKKKSSAAILFKHRVFVSRVAKKSIPDENEPSTAKQV
ncbi:MAG: hypothetical protein HYZ48_05430 [Chlamydiales bacterium]|nr:hypothetical protein [Chlamydiales bacterium]